MSKWTRASAAAVLAATLVSTGCATRSQLQRGLDAQAASLEAQAAALEAERAERIAGDQRLASDMGSLNSDLASLKTDYGVRIAQLEEGLEFGVPVHFAFDAAQVDADDRLTLERFAQLVQRHYPGSMITVEGFADPAGSAEYNRRLSERRAAAVRESLVAMGLPESQIRSVGYGEDRLIVPGAAGQAAGAELNRRVVFVVETPELAGVIGTPATTR